MPLADQDVLRGVQGMSLHCWCCSYLLYLAISDFTAVRVAAIDPILFWNLLQKGHMPASEDISGYTYDNYTKCWPFSPADISAACHFQHFSGKARGRLARARLGSAVLERQGCIVQ